MMYASWIWSVTDSFFVILGHFLHFYPTKNLQNQNFEKMKKMPTDVMILHMCTINDIISCMVPEI